MITTARQISYNDNERTIIMSRILLLEDDTMIASGILYALESEGYETNHATRIKDARSLIEHYKFDLAIIDMQLPDGTVPRTKVWFYA